MITILLSRLSFTPELFAIWCLQKKENIIVKHFLSKLVPLIPMQKRKRLWPPCKLFEDLLALFLLLLCQRPHTRPAVGGDPGRGRKMGILSKLANWQTWQSGSLPHNGHIQANVPDAVFISSQDKTWHHLAVDRDSNWLSPCICDAASLLVGPGHHPTLEPS